MIKSQDMTPDQRADVMEYLDNLTDEEMTPDDWEIALDCLVDMGLAEKGDDGRWRITAGVKIVSDENYHGG